MNRLNRMVIYVAILFFGLLVPMVSADSITRFNFTQPNFTGGGGNSLFDVAVVEQRGGAQYLRNQGKSQEQTVQSNALNIERKELGVKYDTVALERAEINRDREKLKLENEQAAAEGATTSSNQAQEEKPQVVNNYNISGIENVDAFTFSTGGDVMTDNRKLSEVEINNSGNAEYYEEDATKKIETGEYNDVDIAEGTGNVEQNPTSTMTVTTVTGQ